jgi:predicted transcriptional regulator
VFAAKQGNPSPNGGFSISEIEEACPGISRDMVRVVLRAMKAEGLITPTKKGRAAQWNATG